MVWEKFSINLFGRIRSQTPKIEPFFTHEPTAIRMGWDVGMAPRISLGIFLRGPDNGNL